MIVDYKIIKIISESDAEVNFKNGIVIKEVEFEAIPHYLDASVILKRKVELKHWNKAKKLMHISL